MRFITSLIFLLLTAHPSFAVYCDIENVVERLYQGQRHIPAEKIRGVNWSFNPVVDIDMRGGSYKEALETAFKRTGVPKEHFEVVKWGQTAEGKSIPVEYRVKSGPHKGAEVNMDWPLEGDNGPAYPHIGYQTPGKRNDGGAVRGHIILEDVPASRVKAD